MSQVDSEGAIETSGINVLTEPGPTMLLSEASSQDSLPSIMVPQEMGALHDPAVESIQLRTIQMKNTSLVTLLLVATLGGCSDQHDQMAQQNQQASPAQPPAQVAAAAKPQSSMSMKSTDARIATLSGKTSDCNIESVNDIGFEPTVPTISVADPAKMSGWLIDAKQKLVPKDALIRVETEAGDKAWEQPVASWNDRGDIVTTHNGIKAYEKSGFQVQLGLGDLVPGAYNIYLVYGAPGAQVACGVGRRFNVK